MPKGEMKFIEYNPGEAPVESLPAEDGTYELTLKDKGKPGAKGWKKSAPTKFPNRRTTFKILGTEDEVTGEEKNVTEFFSLSPGFPLQRVAFLAYAVGYPKKLKLVQGPKGKPNDPSVMQNMQVVDELLQWIEDNEVTLRAQLGTDTYNGRENNRIQKYLPSDGESAPAAEEAEETEESDEETVEEETEETEEETAEVEEEDEESNTSESDDESEEGEDESVEDEDEDAPSLKVSKSKAKKVVKVKSKKRK